MNGIEQIDETDLTVPFFACPDSLATLASFPRLAFLSRNVHSHFPL